jgi:hypothetical protein
MIMKDGITLPNIPTQVSETRAVRMFLEWHANNSIKRKLNKC